VVHTTHLVSRYGRRPLSGRFCAQACGLAAPALMRCLKSKFWHLGHRSIWLRLLKQRRLHQQYEGLLVFESEHVLVRVMWV